MRETDFINQNREKWTEFEDILANKGKSSDSHKLSDLFVEITDDLSYSRTFYPNRSVRVYLNNLSQKVFLSIYKNQRVKRGGFMSYWRQELPQLVYESRREFRISFIVFIISVIIGMLSTYLNPEFPRVILGDDYVNQTLRNIENGDPMAVYKDADAAGMALQITINNLRVALITFVLGVFFSFGSLGFLLYNGIMIGAFQYFFYTHGVFVDSFLTIWIHGTLEISAIIIAGAAGVTLGRGLVFPGTYSRLQALQLSGRRGLKIFIGITPIIVLAGMIEGFLTRYTEAPYALRGAIIGVSLLFILLYFVWLPWYLGRRGHQSDVQETRLPPSPDTHIEFDKIKSVGTLFADSFVFYQKIIGKVVLGAVLLAILSTGILHLISAYQNDDWYYTYFHYEEDSLFLYRNSTDQALQTYIFQPLRNTLGLLSFGGFTDSLFWVVITSLTIIGAITISYFNKSTGFKITADNKRRQGFKTWMASALVLLVLGIILMLPTALVVLSLIFLVPFLLLWLFTAVHEPEQDVLSALPRSINLASSDWFRMMSIYLIMALMLCVMSVLLVSPLSEMYLNFIQWNLTLTPNGVTLFQNLFQTTLYFFALYCSFPLMLLGCGMLYFTLREIREAPALNDYIEKIGNKRRVYGLEQEV